MLNRTKQSPLRYLFKYVLILAGLPVFGQNISVDAHSYSAQELVKNVLIHSGCIQNIQVTHAVSGNFNDGDKSYGYFQNNGGSFPFANGIVMSTGKLAHVPGPNTTLSDDDAPGWTGDSDLENFLNINHTVDATVIEFDFVPNANNIRFRYIFASEEYRKNNPTTCQYSDAFAFLIKPIGGTYENIAVIPGTDIPVKVTTVHPAIPGGCGPENEQYFGSWNNADAPINFNGETKILTAAAQVTPGTTYHIKLVIADEQNYRYDSAVFLEGESFNIGANLGEDISGLCQGETATLTPQGNGIPPQNYHWYMVGDNGNETLIAQGANQDSLQVSEGGTYKVVIDYGPDCSATDEIKVSYVDFSSLTPITIYACDDNGSGLATYDLPAFNNTFTQGHQDFEITGFFLSQTDAQNNINPIENPESFQNTTPDQVIYARIVSERGCTTTLKIILSTGQNDYDPVHLLQCSDSQAGTLSFSLNQAVGKIQEEIGQPVQGVQFFETPEDANLGNNSLDNDYSIPASQLPHSLYARLSSNTGCQGLIKIVLNALAPPQIDPNYQPPAFCDGDLGGIILQAGVIGDESDFIYAWDTGDTTSSIKVYEPGDYTVTISRIHLVDGDTLFCSTTHTLSVVTSDKPTVTYQMHGHPNAYKIEIIATGPGNYQYSLDNPEGPFTDQNTYPVKTGRHTFYVKDKNGCGTVKQVFFVIGYMKFFTPNGDGYNDYWHLLGVNHRHLQVKEIQIFDRYGKLLSTLSPFDLWNGNFHGKPLPSNDYWFTIVFKDGSVFTHHLTLVR